MAEERINHLKYTAQEVYWNSKQKFWDDDARTPRVKEKTLNTCRMKIKEIKGKTIRKREGKKRAKRRKWKLKSLKIRRTKPTKYEVILTTVQ